MTYVNGHYPGCESSDTYKRVRPNGVVYQHCRPCFKRRAQERYAKDENGYRQRAIDRMRIKREAIWRQITDHYGTRCACCGESAPEFLSLDHADGSGAQHRRSLYNGKKTKAPEVLWLDVLAQGCPDTFRILCHNCNWVSWRMICPHQRGKDMNTTNVLKFAGRPRNGS
jgi:hypothetical protein